MLRQRRLPAKSVIAAVIVTCTAATAACATQVSPAADVMPATHVTPAGTVVPGARCPMFPASNVWNTDISKLPVNSHSAQWLRSMAAGSTNLHPDFGPSGGYPYGIPFKIVTNKHPLVRVRFTYPDSDHVRYPLGRDTPIEGGKNAGGDRHAIMVNRQTCRLYELGDAHFAPGGRSHAAAGATWNLRSNALRPPGKTSADAAGLPMLPGLLNFGQVQRDVKAGRPIRHAIRFTAERTRSAFIWPAKHQAGDGSSLALPPMGARFRLKASFAVGRFCRNATRYCRDAKAILVEMQHYGLILADNGSNWYFQGTAFPRWPDALVEMLKHIPARAFQAVNESCLMVRRNSGLARAKPGCPIG